MTLRRLWQMANGRARQRRVEMVHLAKLVWELGGGKLDVQEYMAFGIMRDTGKGGPIKMSPKLAASVAAKEAEIRANNPNLPKVKTVP